MRKELTKLDSSRRIVPYSPPEDEPSPRNLRASMAQLERVKTVMAELRTGPPCENCVCYRTFLQHVTGQEVRTRSMCAHPTYSVMRRDNVGRRVDFIPKFTCQESRAVGTICGPEGRLFESAVPEKNDVIREAVEEIKRAFWLVFEWLDALLWSLVRWRP